MYRYNDTIQSIQMEFVHHNITGIKCMSPSRNSHNWHEICILLPPHVKTTKVFRQMAFGHCTSFFRNARLCVCHYPIKENFKQFFVSIFYHDLNTRIICMTWHECVFCSRCYDRLPCCRFIFLCTVFVQSYLSVSILNPFSYANSVDFI